MADSSQLSYQTTMPVYPDVSYDTWRKLYGNPDWGGFASNRMFNALTAWANGDPSYSTWRTNLLDRYNADLNAYNTWLSTGAGQRASAESGSYNPSYFGNGSPSASPLDYQSVDPGNGFREISSGISSLATFVNLLQGLALKSAQIRGIQLENEGKSIENSFLPSILDFKRSKLGFDVDWSNLRNSTELYSRYKDMPELWKGGLFSTPYGSYDLRNTETGLMYQKAKADADYITAGIALRNIQEKMNSWSAKEKQFYVEEMQSIEKDLLFGKKDLQDIRVDVEKAARVSGIGSDIVRTIVSIVSLFLPSVSKVYRGIL